MPEPENDVRLIYSHTDSDDDTVELYQVTWRSGRVTLTLSTITDAGTGLVQLAESDAVELAQAILSN
ncbi:hypothetical protein SEA_CHASER_145 [Mycobacterium phage Chaser]|nr:hypothetical protein SEA_CHASER_145 [Mycobacterium phage Chaser]